MQQNAPHCGDHDYLPTSKSKLMRNFLQATFFIASLLLVLPSQTNSLHAQAADTLWVQTYTWEEQNNPETAYDSPGRRWFNFPEESTSSKILMYYKLRCFEDGTAGGLGFPCGEWDYLSYSYLFEHTGALDSLLVNHPHFKFDNQNFEELALRTEGYSDFMESISFYEDLVSTTEELSYEIAEDETSVSYPFGSFLPRMRTQSIWTASELSAAGMLAGEVNGFRINIAAAGSTMEGLQIRIAQTSVLELGGMLDAEWQTAYLWDTTPEAG